MPNPSYDIELDILRVVNNDEQRDNIIAIESCLRKIQVILDNINTRLEALE